MNFKQLLDKFTDEQIIRRIIYRYRGEKKNIRGYEIALKILRKKRGRKTNVSIVVERVTDMAGEKYVHVNGRKRGSPFGWAIELTSWSEWLNMKINPKTLTEFKELDILAYYLWEMTFFGYSDQSVRNKARMLDERVKKSVKKLKSLKVKT